jgi:hypothetical protein
VGWAQDVVVVVVGLLWGTQLDFVDDGARRYGQRKTQSLRG